MKDTLINIADSVSCDYPRYGAEPSDIACAILENLRCDKCKHWVAPTEDWQQGLGECKRLKDDMDNRISETMACGGYAFVSRPEFFCAIWEAK